jgi:hypothetical protein
MMSIWRRSRQNPGLAAGCDLPIPGAGKTFNEMIMFARAKWRETQEVH